MGFKCAAGEKVQENHPDYCKMICDRPQFVSESEPHAQQEWRIQFAAYQKLCTGQFCVTFFFLLLLWSAFDHRCHKLDLILMNSAISKSWRGVFVRLMAEVNVIIKRLNACDSHEGAQSRSMSSSGSLPFPLSIKASAESAVIGVPVWRCVLIYRCGTALKIPN